MNIRPISDLRNRYADVERDVIEGGPVFLTKNGYGSMVVMSVGAIRAYQRRCRVRSRCGRPASCDDVSALHA